MSLKLGELVAYLKTDNTGLRKGLDDGRREVRRGGKDMQTEAAATAVAMATILGAAGGRGGDGFVRDASGRLRDSRGRFVRAGHEAGEALGEGIYRGADGRLRDARGRFVAAGRQLGEAAGGGARGGVDSLRQALNNFGTGVTNVATNIWNLVPILIGIGAAAVMAVPSVHLLGGALASLPALAAGGGAAIGALGLGLSGLSDHFGQAGGAAGAMVDRAWQVAQAERQLAWAHREEQDAQEALTRAREDEIERLSDLNRELREARLNELEAAERQTEAEQELADARNAVQIAQEKLNRAKASGDIETVRRATEDLLEAQRQQPAEIRRAELAYERAKLAVESAQDRTGDLTREQQRAARVGVEGSDQVKAALDRQRHAVEAVADAEHALAEARRPAGGGGAAAQLMRLAPAAAEFVRVVKSLKPAWESLRLDVQQRLFAGVGTQVKLLAAAWLPTLHERLGGMATTFNGLFKNFSRSARKPQFISDISAGMESVQRLIDRVGKSLTGPFMDAIGRLARAAGPFIDTLGDEVGKLVDDFSRWIRSADRSGALKSFMKDASGFLRDVFDMGRDVGSILGSIVQILFKSPASVTESPWTGLKEGLDEVARWFKDPENQQKVADWIQKIEDFTIWLFTEGLPTVQRWIGKVNGWINTAEEWGGKIVRFKNDIVGAFNSVIRFLDRMPGRISKATRGMWDGLKSSFRSAVNWIIARWNGLSLTIGGGSIMGAPIPSVTLNTPDIPYLAKGGHIMRAGAAVVGDAGPELLELPTGATVRPLAGGGAAGLAGGIHGELRVLGELRVRGSDLVVVLREQVATRGGNVQAVIGTNN